MSTRHTTETFYRLLGAMLREARTTLGLTQRDVGDALGLHDTTITYYEQGSSRMRVLELVQLCEVLKTDASALLARIITEHPQLSTPQQPESWSAKKKAARERRNTTS